MVIKRNNNSKTFLTPFDLLGSDEKALSKAFAYLLGSDIDCYFLFLRFLGLSKKKNDTHYKQASIEIERKRIEGRTDIEIQFPEQYHVIIECKVRGNTLIGQRSQYLSCFDNSSHNKVMCFITQERDTNVQHKEGIVIINTSWVEIIDLFSAKNYSDKPIVESFLTFAIKQYKMRELKEILIQDVNSTEIERFEHYRVYRRNQTFGTPLYFAPYYTRGTKTPEGISYLAKVLGIITLKPVDISSFISELQGFSTDPEQVDRWAMGVRHGQDSSTVLYTYYFLDTPIKFKSPLKKDGGIKKGRGKGWIAAQIPPNRCVTFSDFIRHIPELVG